MSVILGQSHACNNPKQEGALSIWIHCAYRTCASEIHDDFAYAKKPQLLPRRATRRANAMRMCVVAACPAKSGVLLLDIITNPTTGQIDGQMAIPNYINIYTAI